MKKLSFLLSLSFLIVLGASAALPSQSHSTDEGSTLRIAALLPLTGEYLMYGAAFRKGIELAQHEINATGGILGRPLSVIFEDTQYKPRLVHTQAKKVLDVDRVVGGIISTYHEASTGGPVFENKKTPLIVLWDSCEEIEKMGDHVFSLGPWLPSTGETAAQFAYQDLGARTAVVINNNNNWSSQVGKIFSEKFTKLGGKTLKTFAFHPGDSDYRTAIARAKALNPDVLYAPVTDQIVPFFKQLRQLDFQPPVITSDNLNDELIKAAGPVLENIYQTQTADPNARASRKMAIRYRNFFGEDPTMLLFTAWGYDALNLLALNLKKTDNSPQKAARKLYEVTNYAGASGRISFNEKGSSPTPLHMFQIQEGQFVLLR